MPEKGTATTSADAYVVKSRLTTRRFRVVDKMCLARQLVK